ncbi:uncharacterized protein L3040_007748 [Drepanopeziza brunnea f. sp. 'multigermtubi']|uniref:uncharacterized protein n=1 Tax=Drepanopeziza brunnea f. sp. 'multigermtubi' TaxID=698441 RepID=UPI00239EB315|nr:hypothetical protein L3040_007748 [Drepanopeziza brunnea f. sp. 'multigermtubi']
MAGTVPVKVFITIQGQGEGQGQGQGQGQLSSSPQGWNGQGGKNPPHEVVVYSDERTIQNMTQGQESRKLVQQ